MKILLKWGRNVNELLNKDENGLTIKQALFVKYYIVDLKQEDAAIKAGYSKKTAATQASELIRKPHIKKAIDKELSDRMGRIEISQDWVVKQLIENARRCMQAREMTDKIGKLTGVFKWEPAAANRSLELLGKHLGMFKEGSEGEGDGNLIKQLLEMILESNKGKDILGREKEKSFGATLGVVDGHSNSTTRDRTSISGSKDTG